MTKVLGATFLVFYTAFTVVASVEHTSLSAATFARDTASPSKSIRSVSPRSYQARIQEDAFVGLKFVTAFALRDTGSTVVCVPSQDVFGDGRQFTPSRAPPALA